MKKKLIKFIATGVLLANFVPSLSSVALAEEATNSLVDRIETDLTEQFESEVLIDNPEVNVEWEGSEVKVEVEDETISATLEVSGDISMIDNTDQNTVVSIETEDESKNYSISFGTIEDKEKMDKAIANDWAMMEEDMAQVPDINSPELAVTEEEEAELNEEVISSPEDTSIMEYPEVELEMEKVIDEIPMITTEEELLNSNIVLKDLDTGEMTEVSLNDGSPSVLPLIAGFALSLTGSLAASLIKTGAAVAVGTAIGFVVVHTQNKKKKKNYSIYAAKSTTNGLVCYMPLSFNAAVSRLMRGGEVWSTTSRDALMVAKGASPIHKSTSAELHRKSKTWRFHHYHPAIGKKNGKYVYRGTHSFYGTGVYG